MKRTKQKLGLCDKCDAENIPLVTIEECAESAQWDDWEGELCEFCFNTNFQVPPDLREARKHINHMFNILLKQLATKE